MEMFKISEQEYEQIREAARKNKNKRVDKKLQVLMMRHENKGNEEIAARTGYNVRYITTLMGQYKQQGLEEYIRIKQTSHHRNLSVEQEAKVLASFEEKADAGHELTVSEIRQGLETKLGKETPANYVYRVLHRHGWRKVMPRPKHPKAATEEEQDSSKKLKSITKKSSQKNQTKVSG